MTIQEHLTALLREAGPAHHRAFIDTNGADPEWPLWYVDYLYERVNRLLEASLTKSELVYLLVRADKEHAQNAPHADWPSYYANVFLQHLQGGKQ